MYLLFKKLNKKKVLKSKKEMDEERWIQAGEMVKIEKAAQRMHYFNLQAVQYPVPGTWKSPLHPNK